MAKEIILNGEGGNVWLKENFLNKNEEKKLFEKLKREVEWEQRTIKMFGKEMLQPRLIAWYGDDGVEYKYSGNHFKATPWTASLKDLKKKVESDTGYKFNSALINLYEHGQHSMSWHRDNEKELGENPVIASVSLGVERKFQFKHVTRKRLVTTYLRGGSLMLMLGETQHYWKHALPKQKGLSEPRINITFRNVLC